jgi:hypothetical protein
MFKDQKNVNDPLTKPQAAPDAARVLFGKLAKEANGFNHDDVVGAAGNMLINALRQRCAKRQRAEAEIDELFGRLKSALLQHYDGADNRRSVFPFDQTIVVPTLRMTNRFLPN